MRRSVAILTAMLLSGQAWAQAEKGLVGYWSFDEGQGREVRDASGQGHRGSLRGGAKWVQGRHGAGLEFNGTDSLVEITNPQGLNTST